VGGFIGQYLRVGPHYHASFWLVPLVFSFNSSIFIFLLHFFCYGCLFLFIVLLTETWHFPCQQLPHVEGFDSLVVTHTMQLGKTKSDKT
jgi:hypothetical protein